MSLLIRENIHTLLTINYFIITNLYKLFHKLRCNGQWCMLYCLIQPPISEPTFGEKT